MRSAARGLCVAALSASAASPAVAAGVPLRGPYVLRVEPAVSCGAPQSSYSFRVAATAAEGRRRGVTIVSSPIAASGSAHGAPLLEMELLQATRTVTGSLATMPWQDAGVRSEEGAYLWVQGIATGTVSGGLRGDVWQGTMVADLSFGRAFDDRDGLGQCKAALCRWSLRIR